MRGTFLFGIAIFIELAVACVHPAQRAADPELERIQRLARLSPLVVTDGYSYAFATGDCDPADHPVMALYLLDQHDDAVPPKTRHIRVRVFEDPASLTHQRIQWHESRGPGVAYLCSNGSCDAMTFGHIDFGVVKPGKSLEGELDLRFTNDIRVRKRFHARWLPTVGMCG
jgi:hypothetical protein